MHRIFLLIWIVLAASCNNLEKIKKSKDVEYKLQKANEFFDKKMYVSSNTLYEELLPVLKGTKRFEAIYFKYCLSYYYQRNYLAASYHFKNFTDLYPKSDKADQAAFYHASCLFYDSKKHTLDQSSTVKSIEELQNYIMTHPESPNVKTANSMIDEARSKLEAKDLYAAELYYKISQYRAASVYFQQLLNNYPDSENKDYFQYMSLKSGYKYAQQSVTEKQKERFETVIKDYEYFMDINPKNQYKNDMDNLNSLSLQAITKL